MPSNIRPRSSTSILSSSLQQLVSGRLFKPGTWEAIDQVRGQTLGQVGGRCPYQVGKQTTSADKCRKARAAFIYSKHTIRLNI